ncbi:lipoyl synthase, partial [Tanacetum coccineum]
FTGAILLKNGKLSDFLGELQLLVKEYVGKKRNGADDECADAITNQVNILHSVRRLAMEVRQLASPRPITVVNESSSVSITSLVGPVVALGAAGYGYMWWKRLTFSDLMYVTKHNMANAVSNLKNNLEQVTNAIVAAKRHLIQRVQNLEGRMDKQVEISKLNLEQLSEVRDKLSNASNEVELLCNRLSRMDGRVMTIDERMNLTNAGVWYLCNKDNENTISKRAQGNRQISSLLDPNYANELLTNGVIEDRMFKSDMNTRMLNSLLYRLIQGFDNCGQVQCLKGADNIIWLSTLKDNGTGTDLEYALPYSKS